MVTFCDNEDAMKELAVRHQQEAYALCLYLTGSSADKAYDIAASAFVSAAVSDVICTDEKFFLAEVLKTLVNYSREAKVVPVIGSIALRDISKDEEDSLKVVLLALRSLPFEERLIMLLRDQLHMTHRDMAYISGIAEGDIMIRLGRAREMLRNKMMEMLDRGI